MLKTLTIRNFQSIRDELRIDFKPLTFLYGPNSVGKSAIFDALELLAAFCDRNEALPSFLKRSQRPPVAIEIGGPPSDADEAPRTEPMMLSVSIVVDALSLSYLDSGTFALSEYPDLHATLQDGAIIELVVSFKRGGDAEPISMQLFVNGDEHVRFDSQETLYDPYYRLDPNVKELSISPNELDVARSELHGAVHLSAAAARSMGFNPPTNEPAGRRQELLFSHHQDGTLTIRGVTLVASPRRSVVRLPSSTWRLASPNDELDAYIDRRVRALSAYALSAPYCDAAHYRQFLNSELNPSESGRLCSRLHNTRRVLGNYIDCLLAIIGHSCRVNRIRGDRTPVKSDVPIHLPPAYQSPLETIIDRDESNEDPLFSPFGAPIIAPRQESVPFMGADRLQLNTVRQQTDQDRILRAYAERGDTELSALDIDDEALPSTAAAMPPRESRDFPNFALATYMTSLRRYRYVKELYFIHSRACLAEARGSGNPIEDAFYYQSLDRSELDGSRLMYFRVLEDRNELRSLEDVGSSLGYLLPVLVALGEDKTCVLEEPELHLHPLAQEELADVFIHARRGRRVIVESHSETFLQRISQRIKETKDRSSSTGVELTRLARDLMISPEDVRIFLFTHSPKEETRAHQVSFAADGSLADEWPDDFMFNGTWKATLGRLALFSKSINPEDVAQDWPWIHQVEDKDPLLAKWLCMCWMFQRLGVSSHSAEATYIGKITERVFSDRFVKPQSRDTLNRNHEWPGRGRPDSWTYQLFKVVEHPDKPPGLQWWVETLVKMRSSQPNLAPLVDEMRRVAESSSWAGAWLAALTEQGLIALVGRAKEIRNKAAHSSEISESQLDEIRVLIADGSRPGVLLQALGYVTVQGGFSPRVVRWNPH